MVLKEEMRALPRELSLTPQPSGQAPGSRPLGVQMTVGPGHWGSRPLGVQATGFQATGGPGLCGSRPRWVQASVGPGHGGLQ